MVNRLDFQGKDYSVRHGSIWSAASVFSKKFQKWRQDQQKSKKRSNNNKEVVVSNQLDRFQVADFGHGRRSCDIAPRFSLDGCRMSLEDHPCYSFDEPRASCDVHFLGRTEMVPGGTSMTREYYADSSSRRRQSFDHSVSIRKMAAEFVDESMSKAKVSPATVLIDKSEIMGSKKSRRWMNGFNIWGFIHRRSKRSEKTEKGSRSSTGVELEGSPVMCVSWPEVRKEEKVSNYPMMLRSKSSISFRNSYELGGGINGNGNGNGNGKKNIVLERNQSARSSSKEMDQLQWRNSRRWMGGSVMRMY